MDDLILVGMLSIAALYAAGAFVLGAGVLFVVTISKSVMAGDPFGAAALLAVILAFLAAYTGTGLWLQRTGRI